MNPPRVGVEHRWTAADQRQAEYYQHLLDAGCGDIDRRISKFQTAATRYEARGNADDARRVRRMIRTEQRERQMLEQMLGALRHRFALPVLQSADGGPRAPRGVVTDHAGPLLRSLGHAQRQPHTGPLPGTRH